MTSENRNMILAIVLSMAVLVAWQYFSGIPEMERQRQIAQEQQQAQQQAAQQPATPGAQTGTQAPAPAGTPPTTAPAVAKALTRAEALALSPRVAIDTPRVVGTVALKGGRIDDLSLKDYRETVDPKSPIIVLLSPSAGPSPFYAEFGWVSGANVKVPTSETVWTAPAGATLTNKSPLVLTWDNGAGLIFRRTISVDENYMFDVKDEVQNTGAAPVSLNPFALVSRHGTPHTLGYYILHEGLIGVTSEAGLHEIHYKDIAEKKSETFPSTGGWLGITDKYWAATVIPANDEKVQARFSASALGNDFAYQTDFLGDAVTIAPGAAAGASGRLFAGAKEVRVVDGYRSALGIDRFDLLIDWGWFYFITKPLFLLIDWIYKGVGNFG
ncbi:MAG: rane protein insertase, YidC/Oxa1 family domain containing protein, partial [Xanthobacteraceae bacterium]|nr:rane protein insertase, YidC/Oxa1 family domain containing protein [Xanthobacteraceae bacterium]